MRVVLRQTMIHSIHRPRCLQNSELYYSIIVLCYYYSIYCYYYYSLYYYYIITTILCTSLDDENDDNDNDNGDSDNWWWQSRPCSVLFVLVCLSWTFYRRITSVVFVPQQFQKNAHCILFLLVGWLLCFVLRDRSYHRLARSSVLVLWDRMKLQLLSSGIWWIIIQYNSDCPWP